MEPGSDWRVIEPEGVDDQPRTAAVVSPAPDARVPRWLIAAIVTMVTAAAGLAIWATLPTGGVAVDSSGPPFDPRAAVAAAGSARPSFVRAAPASASPSTLMVDVEGAVAQPGLHELGDGSRLGDAIAAAGGYTQNVDIAAASQSLNLAAKLTDGEQVRVPVLGESAAATPPPVAGHGGGTPAPGTSGALIDINHATAEELDTLPGIGPVTAAKIIDARTQQPFASVDELQSRGVVGPSTFDKLRSLVTVNP